MLPQSAQNQKESVIDNIVHFYLGLTFVLLLHCVVGAYFLSRGRRISRSMKVACFGFLAVCASVMIVLIIFQLCFSKIIAPIDAVLMLTPLAWLLVGDLFMYGQAVRKRYKLADGSRARQRA
jgi:lipopolysaccharide export LptBFGC system permease protein LptF